MNTKKTLKYFIILFIFVESVHAQQIDSIRIEDFNNLNESNYILTSSNDPVVEYKESDIKDSIFTFSTNSFQQQAIVYPPTKRDFKKLGYNTGLFLGVAVIGFGILWVMPESSTGWDKESIKEDGITDKWKKNVKAGPIMDHDDWVLNYVTHPYSGAVYFMTARSCGFTFIESFAYSAIMSTFFWEYGIEAFAEVPSTQDLIITPVLGSVLGEGFFYAKKSILKSDKKILKSKVLGVTALILMDPFNTFLDACGYKQKVKTNFNVAPLSIDNNSNKTIWGLNFKAQF